MEVLLMCDVKKYSDIFREIKKLNPDDVYFVTINCCEGHINKKPYFVAPKDLASFNVKTAKNTIIKQ